MPSNVVKSFAERSHKSIAEVEQLWRDAKAEAKKKFAKNDPHFWAYVTGTVRHQLGLKEAKLEEMEDLLCETQGHEKA